MLFILLGVCCMVFMHYIARVKDGSDRVSTIIPFPLFHLSLVTIANFRIAATISKSPVGEIHHTIGRYCCKITRGPRIVRVYHEG
jgi:hypothetical protein